MKQTKWLKGLFDMVNLFRKPPVIGEVVSRSEYREILLARMAAGDLYAAETLAMVRKADMAFDLLREKPIYKRKE